MIHAQRIVSLNNEGINRMQQCQFLAAVACFRSALQLHEESKMQAPRIEIDVTLPVVPVLLEIISEEEHTMLSPNNMFCFFQQALSFDTDYVFVKKHHTKTVLLYNLGLSYHFLAMVAGTRRPSLSFSRALQCYKLALSSAQASKEETSLKDFALPTLALLVNLGHVYSHHYRVSEAQSCRDHLRFLLESNVFVGLSELQEDFFFEALTYSMTLSCTLAPAA